eukprot:COSAG01_NODE_72366_length_253_cov_0.668831_1_plen_84_part_11
MLSEVAIDEVGELIKGGAIGPSTMVLVEGMTEFSSLAEFIEAHGLEEELGAFMPPSAVSMTPHRKQLLSPTGLALVSPNSLGLV